MKNKSTFFAVIFMTGTFMGCMENDVPSVVGNQSAISVRDGIPHFNNVEEYSEALNRTSMLSDADYAAWTEQQGFESFAIAYAQLSDALDEAPTKEAFLALIDENQDLVYLQGDQLLPRVRHTYEGRLTNAEGLFVVGSVAKRWLHGNLLSATAGNLEALKGATIDENGQLSLPSGVKLEREQPHFPSKTEGSCGTSKYKTANATNDPEDRKVYVISEHAWKENWNGTAGRLEMTVTVYGQYKIWGIWKGHATTCIYEYGKGELNTYGWENGVIVNMLNVYTHPRITVYDSRGWTQLMEASPWISSSDVGSNTDTGVAYWNKYQAKGRTTGTPDGVWDRCGYN